MGWKSFGRWHCHAYWLGHCTYQCKSTLFPSFPCFFYIILYTLSLYPAISCTVLLDTLYFFSGYTQSSEERTSRQNPLLQRYYTLYYVIHTCDHRRFLEHQASKAVRIQHFKNPAQLLWKSFFFWVMEFGLEIVDCEDVEYLELVRTREEYSFGAVLLLRQNISKGRLLLPINSIDRDTSADPFSSDELVIETPGSYEYII
jgi:hypothetical protein